MLSIYFKDRSAAVKESRAGAIVWNGRMNAPVQKPESPAASFLAGQAMPRCIGWVFVGPMPGAMLDLGFGRS
jgi:hypothetical protein